MRVFVLSDLHTDFAANRLLLKRLLRPTHENDVLIVAGDIADRLEVIKDTLSLLHSKFLHVFYTPGNHELWVRTEGYDSVQKLSRILELCDDLNIHTRPKKVQGVWIVPLFSWYDDNFDVGLEMEGIDGWADYHFCKWPAHIESLSEFFLRMNEPNIKRYDDPVISFSHFLPRRDILPAATELRFKALPKVAGCASLDHQVRKLGSIIHVFGHSHINYDSVIDGVRYVQNAFKYPRERGGVSVLLKLIWDGNNL